MNKIISGVCVLLLVAGLVFVGSSIVDAYSTAEGTETEQESGAPACGSSCSSCAGSCDNQEEGQSESACGSSCSSCAGSCDNQCDSSNCGCGWN